MKGKSGLRDRMYRYFVPVVPQLLRLLIICVLMGHVESCSDRTSISVLSFRYEKLFRVKIPVFCVDCVIEGQDNHLRNLVNFHVVRN